VDDFVTHVDRRAEALDRQFDNLDRPVDARAKAARRRDQDVKRRERGEGSKRLGHGGDVSDCLQPAKALPMTAANSIARAAPAGRRRLNRGSSFVTARSLLLLSLMLATTACGGGKVIEDGGVYTRRTVCPQVAIPAGTGDVTLFDPVGRTDSAALDVVATITNVRSTCSEAADPIVSSATFDVVATRRDAGAARQVILPYYDVAMQGGTQVVAKRIGQVAVDFAAGSRRGSGRAQATIRINRASTGLPEDVRAKLTQKRKSGDVDAAIDPLSDPLVRAAVARATFEHLIGFQLTGEQLRYNATR
jgi:hypothetical protein